MQKKTSGLLADEPCTGQVLAPCPFCGGEPTVDTAMGTVHVMCRNHPYGVIDMWGYDFKTAFARWNGRCGDGR